MYKLYARPGWGSVLVEAQLAWYGLDYELEELDDLFASAAAREQLAPVNPLAQIPTLVLPDGQVMTESAAITLHLADVTGSSDLVPAAGEAVRPKFLRWLVFLVANVYPTFTYMDDPARFVSVEAARQPFADSVSAYRERLWAQVEENVGSPWFLGDRFSALDIYLAGHDPLGAAPRLVRRTPPGLARRRAQRRRRTKACRRMAAQFPERLRAGGSRNSLRRRLLSPKRRAPR
jgi:GST-like protein